MQNRFQYILEEVTDPYFTSVPGEYQVYCVQCKIKQHLMVEVTDPYFSSVPGEYQVCCVQCEI